MQEKINSIADYLWGNKAKSSLLFFVSIILLFSFLGAKDIWTQEHRWADIVSGMLYRQDFFHPYLGEHAYYDKPLLSYWLILFFVKITGVLSAFTLRLPSALAGLLSIFSIYRLGISLKNKQLGLLAGWLLLSTFYFLFWARVSSSDMLNLAGSLTALAWYFAKRRQSNFFHYSIFFLIIAFTALCKGLVGVAVPAIAVLCDIVLQKTWRKHFCWAMWLGLLPGLIIYLLPFFASSFFSGQTTSYHENGLYLVYRENILRYFQPFDHKGPIYTYFIFLPVYLLPWSIFFIAAIANSYTHWKKMDAATRWMSVTWVALFLFFSLSGSRRSYYILPVVPFALLFTANWLLTYKNKYWIQKSVAAGLIFTLIFLFLSLDLLPRWYYSTYGVQPFAHRLQNTADQIKPWRDWNVVMLDAESKLNFYLHLPPDIKNYRSTETVINQNQSVAALNAWPILKNESNHNTIFISRRRYLPMLKNFFQHYQLIEAPAHTRIWFLKKQEINSPIAFIPLERSDKV